MLTLQLLFSSLDVDYYRYRCKINLKTNTLFIIQSNKHVIDCYLSLCYYCILILLFVFFYWSLHCRRWWETAFCFRPFICVSWSLVSFSSLWCGLFLHLLHRNKKKPSNEEHSAPIAVGWKFSLHQNNETIRVSFKLLLNIVFQSTLICFKSQRNYLGLEVRK